MKNFFNNNKRDNKAEARRREAEHWDELSKKVAQLSAELHKLEQVESTLDKVETHLGILVDSKKHKQEVK